jgi:hypothetical protein
MSLARITELLEGEFGKHGGLVIDDASAHTGAWGKLTITESTAFTTLTIGGFTGTITGITFSAGTEIHGDITAITLASGSCIAYNA